MDASKEHDEGQIAQLVQQLADVLQARQWTLVTAESCTGGAMAKVCTDQSGCSRWFERGYVTYSNEAKEEDLGVFTEDLESQGAVSATVARAMADGARANSGADLAVAITGVAGPDGGTDDKPVGGVWFGFSTAGRESITEYRQFSGDRCTVRREAVHFALRRMLRLLIS